MGTFLTSDRVRIAYRIDDFTDPWKAPKTIVLLHSAMGSARRFYSMVPGLARHLRVARPDLRGHGESQIPPADSPLDKERLARDVVELLDALGLEQVHVLGASAGGYIGQQLAIQHPARVRSLALFGATPGFKGDQGKYWLREAARRGMREFFEETIGDRFPREKVDPGLINWFLDEISKNDLDYLARFIGYWTDTDFMDEVHRITCPVLIVVPGALTVGSGSLYWEMRKRIGNSELLVYENERHNIWDYLPERCAGDTLAFLRRHFPGDFLT